MSQYTRFPGPGTTSANFTRYPTISSGGGGSLVFGSAMVPSAGTTIVLELVDTGTGPVLPTTAIRGFTATVNGSTATISSIARTAASEYTLTLSALITVSDDVLLTYVPGNVHDSSFNALQPFSMQEVTNNSTQGYDPDAQTYFNNIVANSGTISVGDKQSINDLVLDLKAASIWTKLDEIYPFCGDQLSAALVKLKFVTADVLVNPGSVFVPGDYTHGAGLKGNGTSKYLTTTYLDNTNAITNISLGFYQAAQPPSGSKVAMGTLISGADLIFLRAVPSSTPDMSDVAIGAVSGNMTSGTSGLVTGSRTGGSVSGYLNATAIFTNPSVSGAEPGLEHYLFAANGSGTPVAYADSTFGFAFIGQSLSSTDVGNLFDAVTTYLEAIA